ncbi:MAG TPA: hypothetical protein VH186_19415, partial [Chloroflexia bacterium]|nr:hypothetical protein [Chloroflexia bacterium]
FLCVKLGIGHSKLSTSAGSCFFCHYLAFKVLIFLALFVVLFNAFELRDKGVISIVIKSYTDKNEITIARNWPSLCYLFETTTYSELISKQ